MRLGRRQSRSSDENELDFQRRGTADGGRPETARDTSVRRYGSMLLPLGFAEGAQGVASAGSHLSGLSALLLVHVGFGVGLVILALRVFVVTTGFPRRAARVATGFTTFAFVVTGLTGAIFLLTGFGQGGIIDQGLAVAALAGSALMIP
jgi:hypothetical protein